MDVRLRLFAVLLLASIPCVASAAPRDSLPVVPARASVAPAASAGPRIDRTATAFRVEASDTSSVALQRARNDVTKPVAIMIVGGAAIVLGSVVGDEVGQLIMIGGVVALLYGLYQYLK